ncbi:accessory Sec system glycosyltransferase GtfA [Streptococcus panodentis]|uniref:UDP-N-acetylglucosamine--peptide N-acetylglucosaminyltransferase GtfA subunit n=1 Tax=Streptococcus panodentis TaxID=1581472 RepID=A0ABS5AZN2_9STRE|nr:accessory Sec system glycosyltransferase GtfA [Streptococcus panodentis]MBP2621169.1 accessory Sec system glycosyltransferase GtfA [Streptococcus panodentis]
MTVYNINLGIGWASSGVEYAQAYRAQLLRRIGQPAKFIFMDMILADNIQHLTENIGFRDEEVIWLYQFFTDVKLAPTTVTLDDLLASVAGRPDRSEREGRIVRYFYSQEDVFITCYLRQEDQDFVEHAEYVSRGRLIRKDYFSYVRYASEYFAPHEGAAALYQRRFYNEDGSVAYDMLLQDGQEELYRFPDRIFYSKPELVRYFLRCLDLQAEDILILDRETGIGQVVFEECRPAKLGVVVHAEHFSENASSEDYILWNNFYDYQFTNADKVDFFIVATAAQRDILTRQFERYSDQRPKIVTIPVGSLDRLIYPEHPRRPFSMITASRLATEKHIDWLLRAAMEAHKTLPDLTLDIYGKGGEEAKLRRLIEEGGAQDYIRLKGHADLSRVYADYELYLTASTSEGFGLTLMEAVGSGLPLIGFDVRYGNQTFIKDGENGYLLPASASQVEEQIISAYAAKIQELFEQGQQPAMSQKSYEIAADFLTSRVEAAWKELIEEVGHDSAI